MERLGFQPESNLPRQLGAITAEQIALESLVDKLFAESDARLFAMFDKIYESVKEENNHE